MNEKNLISNEERTPSERRENARKAGIASGKARKEKRTVKEIIRQIGEKDVSDIPALEYQVRKKWGIKDEKSIKEIIITALIMNTIKKGDLSMLDNLMRAFGEADEENANNGILDELAKYLKLENKDNNVE